MIDDRKQYIVWKDIPFEPKNKKVPWNVDRGEAANPHDSNEWMSHADAAKIAATSSDLAIGYVLSNQDPYFLLDLDKCRDPATGQWTPEARQVASMFPNAAMEVSVNGTGMHIMGCLNPVVLGPTRHRFYWHNLECEFYHEGRFVALGHGLQGDLQIDWTSTLDAFVPKSEEVEQVSLVEQAVPEYTGPEDDDQLIQLMLKSRGSANQIFGNKATIPQLWNADAEVLGKVFPSETGHPYNASSADAALMSHLAFYTGKNTARMDRLFRRSGLMRDKYNRPGYVISTISGAVAGCKMVYDKPRQEILQVAPGGQVNPNEMRIDIYPDLLNAADQAKYFEGCVYVVHDHKVMIPGGTLLKPTQFKALYGGHTFLISSEMIGKTSTNCFEAFTENRVVRFPKVSNTCFRPQNQPGEIIGNAVNVYYPEDIPTAQGDIQPFLELVEKLLPNQLDRDILMAYCASLVQNQGHKFLWAIVLQGVEGNGKSMIGEFLLYCVGQKYSWTPKADKVNAQFNGFLQNRILINVEEMNMFHKLEMLETLKDYITGTRQEVENKGVDSQMITDYCANWFFCTNHKDAIIKTKSDRRFAVMFTAQQTAEDREKSGMVGNYFPDLWDWARAGGFAAVRHFWLNYQIPDHLNPATKCTTAPQTSSHDEAIMASLGHAEQYIVDAVEQGRQGFRGGWISTWAVGQVCVENNLKRPPRKIASMLEKLGYRNTGRATNPIMMEKNTRPSLWCLPGTTEEYEIAQGYSKYGVPAVSASDAVPDGVPIQ